MKNYFSFLFLLFNIMLMSGCNNHNINCKKIVLTKEHQDDATFALFVKLKEAKEKHLSEIQFEKGIYHFWPEKAYEQFCYISNHNDVLSRIAFLMKNMQNIDIDGNGSTFIFHGRLIPFWIENCKHLSIRNLKIDFDTPFHSEGLIVKTNELDHSFDMKILPEYPYEIRNGQIYFLKPYYSHSIAQGILYDLKTSRIAYQTELSTELTTWKRVTNGTGYDFFQYKYKIDKNDPYINKYGFENPLKVEEIEKGLVRITGHRRKLPTVGTIFACKGAQSENRLTPAFKVNNVSDIHLNNVTVNHAGGMGFLFENCEDVVLDSCQVVPSHGRMVSTTADATHFVGCRGSIVMRNCIFKNQLDDASNIHGTYQEVMDVIDDHTLGVRMGHYQQLGFTLAKAGDTIGMVRLSDSFDAYKKLTVKHIEFVNGRYQLISFNEKLPSKVAANDLLENLSAYPEVLIENCVISGNRARGLLISTPKKTIIRNNYFNTEMTALLFPVESNSWYESGSASNVSIENNVFQDCSISGLNTPVITFITDIESSNIAFRNIQILNNTFNQFDNYILRISNVDGLLFKGNTITKTDTYPAQFPQNSAFEVQYSNNIRFENNNYLGVASKIINQLEGVSGRLLFE